MSAKELLQRWQLLLKCEYQQMVAPLKDFIIVGEQRLAIAIDKRRQTPLREPQSGDGLPYQAIVVLDQKFTDGGLAAL